MAKEGYEYFGAELKGFAAFWEFLGQLSDAQNCCPGCRSGGGYPACEVRKCARAKGVSACPACAEYPCDRIRTFSKVYPTLIADGTRQKEVGVEKWIGEQEERAKTGFAYADIRINRGE